MSAPWPDQLQPSINEALDSRVLDRRIRDTLQDADPDPAFVEYVGSVTVFKHWVAGMNEWPCASC